MIFPEKFMVEFGPSGGRFSLVEVVHVELYVGRRYLSYEGCDVGVLEVMGQEGRGEAGFIFDHEGASLLIPCNHAPVLLLLQHIPRLFDEVRN